MTQSYCDLKVEEFVTLPDLSKTSTYQYLPVFHAAHLRSSDNKLAFYFFDEWDTGKGPRELKLKVENFTGNENNTTDD